MKILALVSAIDLVEPPRATLYWWQLFKNMSEAGVEIIVVPFLGRDVETPWWKCYSNPAYRTVKLAYKTVKSSQQNSVQGFIKSFAEKLNVDITVGHLISDNWEKTIINIDKKEKDIDAIIAFSIPIKPLEQMFKRIRQKIGKKVIYIEADMPEVFSEYNTFGYSYYKNTDLSLFDGFLTNSEGVSETLKKMGARNVGTLHFAIDPEIYKIPDVQKEIDVLFSGVGSGGRKELIKKMIIDPATNSSFRFGVSGVWKTELPRNVTQFGFVPFNGWLKLNCSSYIALDIVRHGHAVVPGTSTYRLFELCGLGLAVVTNKREGIEKFYDPGKEIVMLNEDENPLKIYKQLLAEKETLLQIGSLARKRTLKEHTCMHRALELIDYVRKIQ
jgi:hypothetical protein